MEEKLKRQQDFVRDEGITMQIWDLMEKGPTFPF